MRLGWLILIAAMLGFGFGDPVYRANSHIVMPSDYRDWIYLSSGLDMTYGPLATKKQDGHSLFDNVFVNPEAYRAFRQSGKWPDKTVLVLEVRKAGSNTTLNKAGQFQGPEVTGLELHVKDRAKGGWAFYDVNSSGEGTRFDRSASCYTCHETHAAVDTTFVQFYPTLLPIAEQKGTLSSRH